MADQKGLGSKLIGIFVETGEGSQDESSAEDLKDSPGKSPADIVAEMANQVKASVPQPAAPPPALKLDAMPMAGAPAQFDTIFRDAGMDAAELDRVKKAEELLKSLPEATPIAVKRQIVEASLRAFGFELEKIVLAAQNQKRALDAYVKVNETATAKAITDAEAQIKALNEKIAGLRTDIEKRTAGLGALSSAATARKEQVQKVLDFFAVPPTAG